MDVLLLKQATASQEFEVGPFLDPADGTTEKNALTIANTDVKLWFAGASALASKHSGGATAAGAQGAYNLVFDATDTAILGPGVGFIHVAGALPVRFEFLVVTAAAYTLQTTMPGFTLATRGIDADTFSPDAGLALADNAANAMWDSLGDDYPTPATFGHLVGNVGAALGLALDDIWSVSMPAPTVVPTWPSSPLAGLSYILAKIANCIENNGTEDVLYAADGTTVIARAPITRVGGRLTKGADITETEAPGIPGVEHGPRPFADTSPFNTAFTGTETWVDSSLLHTYWWVDVDAAAIVYAKPSDPLWTFVGPDYIDLDYHRNRLHKTMQVQAPLTVAHGDDSDRILVLVQPDGSYLDIFLTNIDLATRTITSDAPYGWAEGNIVTGPGAGRLDNNDGVRAANFSWAAGLISPEDITAGIIDHALVFASSHLITGSGGYKAPATAWENSGDGGFKLGDRIGVPPGIARPAGLSPIGIWVWNALQTYGAYCGDFAGDNGQFYADHRITTIDLTGTLDVLRLVDNWDDITSGSSDLDRIQPFLRLVA